MNTSDFEACVVIILLKFLFFKEGKKSFLIRGEKTTTAE